MLKKSNFPYTKYQTFLTDNADYKKYSLNEKTRTRDHGGGSWRNVLYMNITTEDIL